MKGSCLTMKGGWLTTKDGRLTMKGSWGKRRRIDSEKSRWSWRWWGVNNERLVLIPSVPLARS
jgi:hypothetical protein